MKKNNSLEGGVLVIENEWIPLKDGRRLAARIWLPSIDSLKPVPAILEYLPYRKRDGTAMRDDSTYPVFARAGYAGVRVDLSGTGESDGEFDDEYSQQEHNDGLEVIDWIARQEWCDGNIGMMGISWGGFNSLQIAARRPDALKAVIAIGTTVDRYNDDIHYKNGCLLSSNFSWSTTMLCFASRAPDPDLVGKSWRETWKHRLLTQPFPLEHWLTHQTRDSYWQHGSICEDFNAITIPSLVISGWTDGYVNAPPSMAANNRGYSRAINGPWGHLYPHYALPEPRLDFHAEAVQWWDRWLKGIENSADDLPAYRAFISEGIEPGADRTRETGRWVAEQEWPSENIRLHQLYPSSKHSLQQSSPSADSLSICSPQDCGTACGEFFPMQLNAEMAGDQRHDDAGSMMFETDVLAKSIDVLGRPLMKLRVAIDKSLGNLAVRLNDVHPNGSIHRVSWGVLNLAHRRSNENPEYMLANHEELIQISLNHCGYRFRKGHRIRLSISTAYWPMVLPPPEKVTATVAFGDSTYLTLPVRAGDDSAQVSEPADKDPLPSYPRHMEPDSKRSVTRDLEENLTHYRVSQDTGDIEVTPHGMRMQHTHEQCYSIDPDQPLSATEHGVYVSILKRGEWRVRTVCESHLRCDTENYYLSASVVAWENEKMVNKRSWEKVIPRVFT